VQGWLLLWKQERRLLRLPKRGPERMSLRVQGRTLLRAQARRPLRQPERWLVRDENRVRFRVQEQHREQTLLRFDERWLAREPLQWPERLLFPALLRRLLQVPERRPHKPSYPVDGLEEEVKER
jgi:hypothetical protein